MPGRDRLLALVRAMRLQHKVRVNDAVEGVRPVAAPDAHEREHIRRKAAWRELVEPVEATFGIDGFEDGEGEGPVQAARSRDARRSGRGRARSQSCEGRRRR